MKEIKRTQMREAIETTSSTQKDVVTQYREEGGFRTYITEVYMDREINRNRAFSDHDSEDDALTAHDKYVSTHLNSGYKIICIS